MSYRSRALQRGSVPAWPSYFLKPPSSLAASDDPVARPPGCALLSFEGEVALVFPGFGNECQGMGRDVALRWPEVLRRQDAENERLRGQYQPGYFWGDAPSPPPVCQRSTR